MHWVDERIQEHKDRQDRKALITRESTKMFDALWSFIMADIEYANETGHLGIYSLGVEGNSSTRDMTIYRPAKERKDVHVKLSQDRESIVVSGQVRAVFPLRICPDGSVCLKDESDSKIEFKDASRRILDPLLFPDLQKPEFSK